MNISKVKAAIQSARNFFSPPLNTERTVKHILDTINNSQEVRLQSLTTRLEFFELTISNLIAKNPGKGFENWKKDGPDWIGARNSISTAWSTNNMVEDQRFRNNLKTK